MGAGVVHSGFTEGTSDGELINSAEYMPSDTFWILIFNFPRSLRIDSIFLIAPDSWPTLQWPTLQ